MSRELVLTFTTESHPQEGILQVIEGKEVLLEQTANQKLSNNRDIHMISFNVLAAKCKVKRKYAHNKGSVV